MHGESNLDVETYTSKVAMSDDEKLKLLNLGYEYSGLNTNEGLSTMRKKGSLAMTEPAVFYTNRETGQCQWEKPSGEFQNTFCTIQNTFAEMLLLEVTSPTLF